MRLVIFDIARYTRRIFFYPRYKGIFMIDYSSSRPRKVISSASFLLIFCTIGWATLHYTKKKTFDENTAAIALDTPIQPNSKPSAIAQPVVIEKVISSTQLWRPIQEQIKDTVVQIITQAAEIDFLQPFKSPTLTSRSGSGFFINCHGEFVTNAHVVEQAKCIWIQVPSLGKRIIDATIVGVSPDRDIALLCVTPESLALIERELGGVPYLTLGDSDLVRSSDEALAVGYPLGQRSVKTTRGVVSGREDHYLQIDVPINPGNSGGPLLNNKGEVVGINTANIPSAQNVGYAIPINDLKMILSDLHKVKILRKPYLGVFFNNATESLVDYLGNPKPGGCYVADVIKDSILDRAGVRSGDMLYEINGHSLDMFGEMTVPWSEGRISLVDLVSRLTIGEKISLSIYRHGIKKQLSVVFDMASLPAIRTVYPGLENIDYEICAGFVVMQLTLNHVHGLKNHVPGLLRYSELHNQTKPVLIITHIFPNSQLFRSQTLTVATTINEVNGIPVSTLDEFRAAIKKSMQTNKLTIRASDNIQRTTDNIFVVLPWDKVVQEELEHSHNFKYPLSSLMREVLQAEELKKELVNQKINA
jgi:serine protease Do